MAVAAAVDRGGTAGDLFARADAAVFHPHPGGGMGDVDAGPLAGAAYQRPALQREGAAVVLADPGRLVRVRRQRRLAARARGADRRRSTGARLAAGAAAVSKPAVDGQGGA